jgi:hypothetical protein
VRVFGSNCRRRFPLAPRRGRDGELIGEAPARAGGSGVELAATFAPSAVDDAAVAQAQSVKPVGDLCSALPRPTLDRAHNRHVAERSPAIRRLVEQARQVRRVAVEQART